MAKLTIDEAAARLGKTVRQVRYMLKQGHLAAHKDGARWLIDSASLPLSEGQREALTRQNDQLMERAAAAVGPLAQAAATDSWRARYSVASLKAFASAVQLARACDLLAAPANLALRSAARHLAQGCHRFHRDDKGASYREARDAASLAVAELHLSGRSEELELASHIETELLPAITSLLSRTEKRSR